MVSALYTLLSVAGVLAAAGAFGETSDGVPTPEAAGVVVGLSLAGLAFARPDGIAYCFVGLSLLTLCHIQGRIDSRAVVAVYAPMLLVLAMVNGAAFAVVGNWGGSKLTGDVTLVLLAGVGLFGALTLVVGHLDAVRSTLQRIGVVRIAVAANVVVVGMVALLKRHALRVTVTTMLRNLLLFHSGWDFTWWFIIIALGISVVFWFSSEGANWRQLLLFAAFEFFAIAIVVCATTHPGRLGIMDSLNRVVLQIVPVIVCYIAGCVGAILAAERPTTAS